MLLNQIALKNFKCFKEVDLKLSKITLLTGENSSGKSSLLYALLTPFQTTEFPYYLSPNGKYVNMGDFAEMSFNNIKDNSIEFDISISDTYGTAYNFKSEWVINAQSKMPKLHQLTIKSDFLEFAIKRHQEFYVLDFTYDLEKDPRKSEEVNYDTLTKTILETVAFYNIKANNPHLKLSEAQQTFEVRPLHKLYGGSLDELRDNIKKNANFKTLIKLNEFLILFNQLDNYLNFISPFRLRPERRTHYQQVKIDSKIGKFGENYIDQILEWEDKKSPKFAELKSILKDLNLLRTIKTSRLRGGRFELRVQVRNRGVWASLADVGFGISQFLPIIVADLQLPSLSTLLIAQPEIHLHPSVQASLADYFSRQVRSSNKQYIIETHSEYLLNRIRLSIAKGEIEPADVAVYYFENSATGTISHHIEFAKDGQIKNAPPGFFKTYMMDVLDIALAV